MQQEETKICKQVKKEGDTSCGECDICNKDRIAVREYIKTMPNQEIDKLEDDTDTENYNE